MARGSTRDIAPRVATGIALVVVALMLSCQRDARQLAERVAEVRETIRAGQYAAAEVLAQELATETEDRYGDPSLELAEALDCLVQARYHADHFRDDETLHLAERAVAMKRTLLGHDHPTVGASLQNLGLVLQDRRDYARAESVYVEALRVVTASSVTQRVATLRHLAWLAWDVGRFDVSLEHFEEAFETLRAGAPGDSLERAALLHGMALTHYQIGDYTEARDDWEEALALRQRVLGPENALVATLHNNLGALQMELGDYDGASSHLERALEIQSSIFPFEHIQIANTLHSLGTLHHMIGDLDGSYRWYARARQVHTRLDASHPRVAELYYDLGRLFTSQAQLDSAATCFRAALSLCERQSDPNGADMARALDGLANVELLRGNLTEARSLVERVLTLRAETLGEQHPDFIRARARLAEVLARVGEDAAAFEMALAAEAGGREHLLLTAQLLAEREAIDFSEVRARGVDVAMALLDGKRITDPEAIRRVWSEVIQVRAVILDEMIQRRRSTRLADDPEIEHLVAELGEAVKRLARISIRGPRGENPERYRQNLLTARNAKDAAERAVARRSASLGLRVDLLSLDVSFEEVRRMLPPRTALVAYTTYVPGTLDEGTAIASGLSPSASRSKAKRLLAFVLPADTDVPAVVPIARLDSLEFLVDAWSREASRGTLVAARSVAQADSAYGAAALPLRRVIWDPLQEFLAGSERVVIVPDGPLHRVNIAALPGNDAAYLVEEAATLHHVAAERDLLAPAAGSHPSAGLLALGNADFGTYTKSASLRQRQDLPCRTFADIEFDPLPGTAQEVDDVVAAWGRSLERDPLRFEQADGVALVGEQATEAAFKSLAPGRRVIHVASHGFFLDSQCVGANASGARGIQGIVTNDSYAGIGSLQLAGLALAGANQRNQRTLLQEDGILTAGEIAVLDLRGVEWMVLSACDTGVGEVRIGEGVLGLRRACRIAGARTLVMSLWAVSDSATQAWMRRLYEARFSTGLDTAAAIRSASLTVLRERRRAHESTHPFYWAAFVAVGDWT